MPSRAKKVKLAVDRILSKIILALIYAVAALPTGLIMRLARRDRLRLAKPKSRSFWKNIEQKEKSYELQF